MQDTLKMNNSNYINTDHVEDDFVDNVVVDGLKKELDK